MYTMAAQDTVYQCFKTQPSYMSAPYLHVVIFRNLTNRFLHQYTQ